MKSRGVLARHRRSCPGKRQHPTREAATAAMRSVLNRTGASGAGAQVYKCLACQQWHWGHVPRVRRS